MEQCTFFEIPINGCYGTVNLYIYPQTLKDKMFVKESVYIGESKYQLQEGSTYTYELAAENGHVYQFAQEDTIISFHASPRHRNEGTIRTGTYVGQLSLKVVDVDRKEEIGKVSLDIRSTKADYEADYRQMLDDIAEYYTDLVLQQGSPVTQRLEIDDSCSSQTLYQRFTFVRSIINSDTFSEGPHKIIANPVRKWTDANIEKDIVGVRRLSRKNIRQIVSAHDRTPLPKHARRGLPACLTSVPRRIDVEYKKDTVDNQENQFVKFVLRTFSMFCDDIRQLKRATDRLRAEAEQTLMQLSNYLENQFFRQISMPTHMNLNSPVLQRKEGYREVLQAWLLFDLAAKLNWTGGDDVYDAGKKNVATLYEYWLFFKLLELISEFFDIQPEAKEKLVHTDSDGINLSLKQGKMQMVEGFQQTLTRKLNVAFYYNRTFKKPNKEEKAIGKAGSWTMAMRPDYTLSLWPGDISQEDAEKEELITHIHFDAKYRLNKIILEDNIKDEDEINKELDNEKQQQELGMYKRADLLKMHAYKDAIRRTSGAYVLYPGTENKDLRGFHEVIPGLGAFSVRPGHWDEDAVFLKQFLAEIKAHLLDRTSDREKLSYYQYAIHREANENMVMECMPEPFSDNRNFLPDETFVLVAYCKSEAQLNWVLENHLYNMRAGDDKGSIALDKEIMNARYILLHNNHHSHHLIRLKKEGPKVYTRAQLIKKGYPPFLMKGSNEVDWEKEKREANRIYLVFNLFESNRAEKELMDYSWTDKNLWMPEKAYSTKLVKLIQQSSKPTKHTDKKRGKNN